MPVSQLVTFVVALVAAFVIVFGLMGAANLGGTPIAQAAGAAVAAIAGLIGGNFVYARFVKR
jgi:hypothetical protein